MPGLNRNGPMGRGTMTGGGRGVCNPQDRRFQERGLGFGCRGGRGRSQGNPKMVDAPGRTGWRRFNPMRDRDDLSEPLIDQDNEKQVLKEHAAALKQELEAIEGRIGSLESSNGHSE